MESFWDAAPQLKLENEADVENQIILPLLAALGYETADIRPKFPVEFREGLRGRNPEADFVCFSHQPHDRNSSLLVVEAKTPSKELSNGKLQGESYVANLRAPVLLMTNGRRFQAWQWHATSESELMVDVTLDQLVANRGKIEALLSKAALIALCKQLKVKSFASSFAGYDKYVVAEMERLSAYEKSVSRMLRNAGAHETEPAIRSEDLIDLHPKGAIILAPSGFGKTTLSNQILHQALERRSSNAEVRIPLHVPLPGIGQHPSSLLEFVKERLAALEPGVTTYSLRDSLRGSGAILFCDAFDRIAESVRPSVQFQLANLLRDFPLVQVFIFSRESSKPDLPLPVLDLNPPNDQELRDLEVLVIGTPMWSSFVASRMPATLRNICENILVARLVFEYWKREGKYPVRLDSLFRAWLDRLLQTETKAKALWLENALNLIAVASANAPLDATVAKDVLVQNGLDPSLLNDLIDCDALHVDGVTIELKHEALADYFRAQRIGKLPDSELGSSLQQLTFARDSLFPTLLMSELRSRRHQSVFWRRVAETDLAIYLDALRYRFDLSEEFSKLDERDLSHGYLEDLLDGIDLPLDAFFPALRPAVARYLTNGDSQIGVTGEVGPNDDVYYGFRPAETDRISVAKPHDDPRINNRSWLYLSRSGYRLDSGHLLGAACLRNTLLKLIKDLAFEGGHAWISERLIGRIWQTQSVHGLRIDITDSFASLEDVLQKYSGHFVPWGEGRADWFSIDSMLRDIRVIRDGGMERLDVWWRHLGWDPKAITQRDEVVEHVLREHYRRLQIVRAEVIEHTFPRIAREFACYTSLPERWQIIVERSPSLRYKAWRKRTAWLPVPSWDEAGAEVTLVDKFPPHDFADLTKVSETLERLGRPARRFTLETMGPVPEFEGKWLDGRYENVTAIGREICELLRDDLDHLFSQLPSKEITDERHS